MNLNYKEFGEGHPLLFLHGLFGMLDNWQTFAKRIADLGFRCILVDQRDHGRSPWTNEFNYDVLATDILEFVNQLDLDEYSLLGHSMGGKTAMNVAKLNNSNLCQLIIIDVAPKKYQRGHDEIFNALRDLPLSSSENRNDLYQNLKDKLHDEMVVQFLMKNIQRDAEGTGFSIKFNLNLLERHYEHIIDDIYLDKIINTDTLFCRGDLSPYILLNDYQKIKDYFSKVKIETIPNAGHWIHADQPELLFQSVADFLLKNK